MLAKQKSKQKMRRGKARERTNYGKVNKDYMLSKLLNKRGNYLRERQLGKLLRINKKCDNYPWERT